MLYGKHCLFGKTSLVLFRVYLDKVKSLRRQIFFSRLYKNDDYNIAFFSIRAEFNACNTVVFRTDQDQSLPRRCRAKNFGEVYRELACFLSDPNLPKGQNGEAIVFSRKHNHLHVQRTLDFLAKQAGLQESPFVVIFLEDLHLELLKRSFLRSDFFFQMMFIVGKKGLFEEIEWKKSIFKIE